MALFFNRHKNDIPKNKQVQDLALAKIVPNPYQPRREFTTSSIHDLAQTIASQGLLQPIIVREKGEQYEIIAGERRFRAVSSLGWETIPAIVNNVDDEKAASLALIENLQREDLNPIDEADAYVQLLKLSDLTQAELAQQVGKSQSYVANKLRLLKLDPQVQGYLASGGITARHGRALLKLSPEDQVKALKEILAHNLTVKQTEVLVEDLPGYFARQKAATKQAEPKPDAKPKKKVYRQVDGDFKVQINTIKKAIKLAKDSGIKVKVSEANDPDRYRITIDLLRK